MPLFELYRMSKEKIDYALQENPPSTTDSPTIPESDFSELVWENGPILMQGQSSRAKRNSNGNTLPSYCLPSHSPKNRDRDRDVGNGISFKSGKSGPLDLLLNDIPLNMNQDDEMGPWLNCHIDDEPFQPGYNSDFLNEFSGVTVNDLSAQSNNNFVSFDRRSSGNYQVNKEFNTLGVNNNLSSEHENLSKISSVEGDNNPPTSSSQAQYQTSFPCFRPKLPNNNVNSVISMNEQNPSSSGSFRGLPMLKQDPRIRSDNNSGLINFSHFSRPVSLYKAMNTQNTGAMPSCSIRIESIGNKDKGSAASSANPNPVKVTNVNTSIGLRREMSSNCDRVKTKPVEEPLKAKICQLDASKYDNGKNASQTIGESAIKGVIDREKTVEPVVASSSVGSGNSVDGASDDPTQNLKRKRRDSENSECPSGDVEEDSVGVKKMGNARTGTGSKRSRAAEVHNLSERRRRDRINEKMRALQELIPNCNKVDKASMLDEAIEYLKTLQLQVQIMSMGTGYYMSPMMFAPGMPQMHAAAHMTHFSPMGLGMGMGLGYGMGMPDMNGGSSNYPTVQVPPLHGPHYPGTPVSGSTALHGMPGSNFPYYGIPTQAHPATMSYAPSVPLSGGSATKPVMGLNSCGVPGPMNNVSTKSPVLNGNPEIVQNAGANSSVGQSSNQVQATNESIAQPVGVQDTCQAAEVTVLKPLNSPKKNEKLPIKEIGYD